VGLSGQVRTRPYCEIPLAGFGGLKRLFSREQYSFLYCAFAVIPVLLTRIPSSTVKVVGKNRNTAPITVTNLEGYS